MTDILKTEREIINKIYDGDSKINVESEDKKLSSRIDGTDPNNVYIGYAVPGSLTSSPVWQIKKLVTSGEVVSCLWADGNTNYDNIWDNRASLSYS